MGVEWRSSQGLVFATAATLVAAQRLSGTDLVNGALVFLQTAISIILFSRAVLTFCGILIHSESNKNTKLSGSLLYGLVFFFFITIFLYILLLLFGAPLFDKVDGSWSVAAYFGAMCGYPIGSYFKGNFKHWTKVIYEPFTTSNSTAKLIIYSGFFSLLGMWIGAISLALDWQAKWQVK